MQTYIALLRGINVGGKHILPMKELRSLLEKLGSENVKTYIQSGNVVFRNAERDVNILSSIISSAINNKFGFSPKILLLTVGDFKKAVESNPFHNTESEYKSLHLFFLLTKPQSPDYDKLNELKKDNERYDLKGNVFYLYAPEGIGKSKLVEKVDKALGVSTTARNWRTVVKILSMAEEVN